MLENTYLEASEAEIADLNVEVLINQHVVTLDVSMNDAK
jgi:hypothetical protein